MQVRALANMSASTCRCAFGELEYKRLLVQALVLAKIRAYTCGRAYNYIVSSTPPPRASHALSNYQPKKDCCTRVGRPDPYLTSHLSLPLEYNLCGPLQLS